jgi:uncharacterized membrane protein
MLNYLIIIGIIILGVSSGFFKTLMLIIFAIINDYWCKKGLKIISKELKKQVDRVIDARSQKWVNLQL